MNYYTLLLYFTLCCLGLCAGSLLALVLTTDDQNKKQLANKDFLCLRWGWEEAYEFIESIKEKSI